MRATSDKILQSALILMQVKGYQSVSIKEIAGHAKVSEMTVFRHFKTKMGVLKSAVERYSYIPCFEKIFEEKIVWDLEKDLKLIAESYLDLMHKNKSIFLIAIQERITLPELNQIITQNTKHLKGLLTSYFTTMQEKNKIKDLNTEEQAIIFLTTLYGYFSSTSLWEDHFLHEWKESFLVNTVNLFCKALNKC